MHIGPNCESVPKLSTPYRKVAAPAQKPKGHSPLITAPKVRTNFVGEGRLFDDELLEHERTLIDRNAVDHTLANPAGPTALGKQKTLISEAPTGIEPVYTALQAAA